VVVAYFNPPRRNLFGATEENTKKVMIIAGIRARGLNPVPSKKEAGMLTTSGKY
jgi:hypothetical protein